MKRTTKNDDEEQISAISGIPRQIYEKPFLQSISKYISSQKDNFISFSLLFSYEYSTYF